MFIVFVVCMAYMEYNSKITVIRTMTLLAILQRTNTKDSTQRGKYEGSISTRRGNAIINNWKGYSERGKDRRSTQATQATQATQVTQATLTLKTKEQISPNKPLTTVPTLAIRTTQTYVTVKFMDCICGSIVSKHTDSE